MSNTPKLILALAQLPQRGRFSMYAVAARRCSRVSVLYFTLAESVFDLLSKCTHHDVIFFREIGVIDFLPSEMQLNN